MLSPREKRQARTRQEILDGALSLIREKGADSFSLRALARHVEYSPAGLYEYFDGKDAILEAVCAEGNKRLQHYLRRVPTTMAPDAYLVELGRAYIEFALENEEHFQLMFVQVSDGPAVAYEEVAEDETYGILLDAVQVAIDAGLIAARDGLNRDAVAYGLWSLAHGLAVMRLTNMRHIAWDFEKADRSALATFVYGLGVVR